MKEEDLQPGNHERPREEIALSIERRKRLAKLEEALMRGYTSQMQLAVKFGVSQPTISVDIAYLRAAWIQEREASIKDKREKRIKQLEYVMQAAHNCFEISRQDQKEVSVTEKPCLECMGTGVKENEWCKVCDGTGLRREVGAKVKTKGTAGDPSWLMVITSCLKEIDRLEGTHKPRRQAVKVRGGVSVAGAVVHGIVNAAADNVYLTAGGDAVINAKVALANLKAALTGQPQSDGRIVEGKVVE